jgi:hypothetical protein
LADPLDRDALGFGKLAGDSHVETADRVNLTKVELSGLYFRQN